MSLNVYKKRSRLRWHSMTPAGSDIQLVKLSHRVCARLNAYTQSTALRFAYRSLNRARKIRNERLRTNSQIKKVAVIRLGSWHIIGDNRMASQLEIAPASLARDLL